MISASIAKEKKASDTIVLYVKEISSVTDYTVICSGSSDRQVRAIADGITIKLKELGVKPLSVEGEREGRWILLDFNDLIVHVFYEEVRGIFRLEKLWPEAERIAIPKGYLKKYEDVKE